MAKYNSEKKAIGFKINTFITCFARLLKTDFRFGTLLVLLLLTFSFPSNQAMAQNGANIQLRIQLRSTPNIISSIRVAGVNQHYQNVCYPGPNCWNMYIIPAHQFPSSYTIQNWWWKHGQAVKFSFVVFDGNYGSTTYPRNCTFTIPSNVKDGQTITLNFYGLARIPQADFSYVTNTSSWVTSRVSCGAGL